MSLQLAAQAPATPPAVPLSESILTRIPADYRGETKEKIRQTEEIQQQAEKMPDGDLVATVLHVLGDMPSESASCSTSSQKSPLRRFALTSFICHHQFHMDRGFQMLFD